MTGRRSAGHFRQPVVFKKAAKEEVIWLAGARQKRCHRKCPKKTFGTANQERSEEKLFALSAASAGNSDPDFF